MELTSIQSLTIDPALLTLEKPLKTKVAKTSLRIGVPKETLNEERRIAIAPSGVAMLVADGHEVYVETGAGDLAQFSDRQYADCGATVVASPADVYSQSSLIVKMFPPASDELAYLQERQMLISALHLGSTSATFIRRLMELNVTAIGFEFMHDPDGTFPIVRMMHEISGSMAVQVAARYLESNAGGRGLMLGGISGIPPSSVLILGAGVVGEWAARTALGFGAHVIVLDTDLSALRFLEHNLSRRITTAIANTQYLQHAVKSADVIIGAMMASGKRSPILVTEEMVAGMKKGSVIVDVVMDQGGCIETSTPTTHSQPVFTKHGVTHYCVPNMPSNAARTATYALSNVLVPYLLEIGETGSINDALWRSASLRNGTYVYRKHLTKKSLSSMFNMPYRDIELLIASGI